MSKLLAVLNAAYKDYHSQFRRDKDPISLVHEFSNPQDQEIAAFFAATLAYGNVKAIVRSVRCVFDRLGSKPYQAIYKKSHTDFSGFKHRFTTGDDLELLALWLHHLLRQYGSIEGFFDERKNLPLRERMDELSRSFSENRFTDRAEVIWEKRQRNLQYLVPAPHRGSACKRLNMFLRWVVRPKDGIDLGLWSTVQPHELHLPVDTHILKAIRQLRWSRSKTATWRVVEEATAELRKLDPNDPIRFDFSLCHLSMSGRNIKDYFHA